MATWASSRPPGRLSATCDELVAGPELPDHERLSSATRYQRTLSSQSLTWYSPVQRFISTSWHLRTADAAAKTVPQSRDWPMGRIVPPAVCLTSTQRAKLLFL